MGREEACTGFGLENLSKTDHLVDPGVDGRITLRRIFKEVGCGGMEWTKLAKDRDRWRELANAVLNLRVPKNSGNFLTSCKPVSLSRRTLLHGVSK
jgi:hypothetical protein